MNNLNMQSVAPIKRESIFNRLEYALNEAFRAICEVEKQCEFFLNPHLRTQISRDSLTEELRKENLIRDWVNFSLEDKIATLKEEILLIYHAAQAQDKINAKLDGANNESN